MRRPKPLMAHLNGQRMGGVWAVHGQCMGGAWKSAWKSALGQPLLTRQHIMHIPVPYPSISARACGMCVEGQTGHTDTLVGIARHRMQVLVALQWSLPYETEREARVYTAEDEVEEVDGGRKVQALFCSLHLYHSMSRRRSLGSCGVMSCMCFLMYHTMLHAHCSIPVDCKCMTCVLPRRFAFFGFGTDVKQHGRCSQSI